MNQFEKSQQFLSLHVKGNPLVLTNIWDAGSAKAIAGGGARAIATGSWSMATAQGYADGEAMPLDLVERIVRQIVKTVDLPVTVDFEGGYAIEPERIADNVERIISAGAIGLNFEDGIIGRNMIYETGEQCRRIEAIRKRADQLGIPLFINARTDLFLQADSDLHSALCENSIARAQAYKNSGASGFFVPGLATEPLIQMLCNAVALPVNIMVTDNTPSIVSLGQLGVSRVSYGPLPYIRSMQYLQNQLSSA